MSRATTAICANSIASRGGLDEALAHGLRAVELAADDAKAHYNLGILYYDRLEIDAAIFHERQALALDPSMAGAHLSWPKPCC